MEALLGIDIGTSGVKSAVFTAEGKLVSSSTVAYPLRQPHDGWAEQDPEHWWAGVVEGVSEALEIAEANGSFDRRSIVGIGLTGQMHGAVLLDENGAIVRPAIIWCDQRSVKEAAWIDRTIGSERVIELTGNPSLPNFTASKVLWVAHNEPDNFKRTRKVLLPKDYIRYRLTGEMATEPSDASGTLLLDVRRRTWSAEILEALKIPRDWMPGVVESTAVSGRVSEESASITGLSAGIPVVGGGGDQAAGAIGNGIVQKGIALATIGTSGVVFASTEELKKDRLGRLHSFCHAAPSLWHVMGVTQAAGGSLQWFRNNLCASEMQVAQLAGYDPYDLITAEASTVSPGGDGLLFLPYLMGERTPHLDPMARGVFFGLTSRHTKAHMARAIIEGVTFSLRDCLSLIEDLGLSISEIRTSGGGSRSKLWRQIQADVYGKPVVLVNSTEGPAFGAALLAGVGVGLYPSVQEACSTTIWPSDTIMPIPENQRIYAEQYKLYRQLYPSLKESFKLAYECSRAN